MKHLFFLAVATTLGGIGCLYHPFWGVLLYYALAVLRPQFLWDWSLPIEVRWSLAAALIAMAGTLLALPRVLKSARFNWFIALTGVFALLLTISYLTAAESTVAGTYGIEYAKIIFLALLAALVIDQLWQVRVLAITVMVVIGYLAYEINYLYFIDGRLDIYHYGFGGLDNNGAGLLVAMGVPLAYSVGLAARRRWQRFGCWLLGIFMVHSVMMSYSRGAMVAALVGGAWMVWHHRSKMQAIGAAMAIGVVVMTLAGPEIRARFLSTTRIDGDRSAQSRLDSWAAGWAIAWDRPMFGQGIRNSRYLSQNFGADTYGRTIHSQYIQVAADSGIPAMAAYIGLLGCSLLALRRSHRHCMERIDEIEFTLDDAPADDATQAKLDELHLTAMVSLGAAGSLVIYAAGALFLSLELFELPWLLMAMAGLLPTLVARRIEEMDTPAPAPEPKAHSHTHSHTHSHPRASSRRDAKRDAGLAI